MLAVVGDRVSWRFVSARDVVEQTRSPEALGEGRVSVLKLTASETRVVLVVVGEGIGWHKPIRETVDGVIPLKRTGRRPSKRRVFRIVE